MPKRLLRILGGTLRLVRAFSLFWLFLMMVILACIFPFIYTEFPEKFVWPGLALQLLGLGTVLKGISDTRKYFGKPSLMVWLASQLRDFSTSFWPPKKVEIGATSRMSAKMSGEVDVWKGGGKNPTLESRIGALEANLLTIREYMFAKQALNQAQIRELYQSLSHEREERSLDKEELLERLEYVNTDGLGFALIGVLWILIGLVFSTIPEQMDSFLSLLLNKYT